MCCSKMVIPYSCSLSNPDALGSQLETFLVRSVSFGSIDARTEPAVVTSFGSGKMMFKKSHSLKGRVPEAMTSFKARLDTGDNMIVSREIGHELPAIDSKSEKDPQSPFLEPGNQRSLAALKLQKVYKSFRTRRQLADCAILVEQRWWKLLDFAELRHSSVSFFDIEKPETAVSRWSRARTRAAKVGKGLLKDEKARKLALQHWLEAIDPRHRYGHNLQFYYVNWLNCESKQPFFYWLDIGEGKEVTCDKCPRSKLQQQCIKYLGPTERKAYEVVVDDGKFFHKHTWELLDTRKGPKDAKWIFVLSTSKTLYAGQKIKGMFQHSSFLAGGATLSAGRLVIEDGILKAVWPHSGHYLPTEENFQEFMSFLKEHNVDLSIVQKSPTDAEEEVHSKETSSFISQNNIAEPDFNSVTRESHDKCLSQEETDSGKQVDDDKERPLTPLSRSSKNLCLNITRLEIPRREEVFEMFKNEGQEPEPSCSISQTESPFDGYETAEEFLSDEEFMVSKQNLYDEAAEYAEPILKEKMIQRINSHKGMKSYQLAQQLSCKWTTGAGPRIGCMRDYPSQLQFRALEEMNLSPRSTISSSRRLAQHSPMVLTPTSSCRSPFSSDVFLGRSPLSSQQVMAQIVDP